MKVKCLIAVATLAVASVACASTNYVALGAGSYNLTRVVKCLASDPEYADPGVFHTALVAVDRSAAESAKCAYSALTRRCPLTARAVLGHCGWLSEKAKSDALALCGYDAENIPVAPRPNESGYVNYVLQSACAGSVSAASARNAILSAAVVPARRTIRSEGGTFVGQEGARKVKELLDSLAAELNAPRFGNAGAILARLGIEVEWDFVQSHIPAEAEVAAIRMRLMGGEARFDTTMENRLCVALGVNAYNEFVREYNGK